MQILLSHFKGLGKGGTKQVVVMEATVEGSL